ncbi:hypothetical protein ES288_A06G203000v1 [Gossypium darwinii]|uniref:Uncharacterized protein n=1 Tax=Gossypium darwinii TaxID=34276 RepID=A0A5D2G8M2_GOSDA|nr:hypothetical protein ES288_A06G203000v1 [Gossypium darwinii]
MGPAPNAIEWHLFGKTQAFNPPHLLCHFWKKKRITPHAPPKSQLRFQPNSEEAVMEDHRHFYASVSNTDHGVNPGS